MALGGDAERLPLWFRLRCGLERRTLAALVVVLVVAALFAAQHFWSGRPQSVAAPEVVAHGVAGAAQEGLAEPDPPPGTTEPAATAPAPDARIVVDVSGKVRRPGCCGCPPGRGWRTPWQRPGSGARHRPHRAQPRAGPHGRRACGRRRPRRGVRRGGPAPGARLPPGPPPRRSA
ncbi:hypothetical protein ACFQ60_18705 [Streptomyces zhihengii]